MTSTRRSSGTHRRSGGDASRLEALDLVRFGRTNEFWRNTQVRLLETDETCATQLAYLADHALASEAAVDAGKVQLAMGRVIALAPTRLAVGSRRFGDGDVAIALHLNGEPLIEQDFATLKIQGGSFKFGQAPIATLTADDGEGLLWEPPVSLDLAIGDEIVLANGSWFNSVLKNQREFTVVRPGVDQVSAPKADCDATSFEADPVGHRWCCRPHRVAEAETSDYFAERTGDRTDEPRDMAAAGRRGAVRRRPRRDTRAGIDGSA